VWPKADWRLFVVLLIFTILAAPIAPPPRRLPQCPRRTFVGPSPRARLPLVVVPIGIPSALVAPSPSTAVPILLIVPLVAAASSTPNLVVLSPAFGTPTIVIAPTVMIAPIFVIFMVAACLVGPPSGTAASAALAVAVAAALSTPLAVSPIFFP